MKKKYELFEAESALGLEELVNKKLSLGWELQGGVSVHYDPEMRDGFQTRFTQAMTEVVSDYD